MILKVSRLCRKPFNADRMGTDMKDLLMQVPLFSDLDSKTLKKIAQVVDTLEVPAGNVIFEQGDVGHEFFFILEGAVIVEKDGKVVNHLCANDFLGEIALIDKQPRTSTVIAETDVKLLAVGSWYFDKLLEITPGLWKAIALALCKYVRAK